MSTASYVYRHKSAARADGALVFAFHGTGGDENQFFSLAEQLRPDAGIVSPRGDVSEHGALRFFRRKAEGVYDFADLAMRADTMADFVRAHKQAAMPSRTIGLGYSNGANILAAVAFKHAELFDDLVLMHPLVPWTPDPNPALAKTRVLITAGLADPICPVPQTTALEAYFQKQGASVDVAWHDGGHELGPNELQAVARFLAQ